MNTCILNRCICLGNIPRTNISTSEPHVDSGQFNFHEKYSYLGTDTALPSHFMLSKCTLCIFYLTFVKVGKHVLHHDARITVGETTPFLLGTSNMISKLSWLSALCSAIRKLYFFIYFQHKRKQIVFRIILSRSIIWHQRRIRAWSNLPSCSTFFQSVYYTNVLCRPYPLMPYTSNTRFEGRPLSIRLSKMIWFIPWWARLEIIRRNHKMLSKQWPPENR